MSDENKDKKRKLTKIEKLEKDVISYYRGNFTLNQTIIRNVLGIIISFITIIIFDTYISQQTRDIKDIIKSYFYIIVAYIIFLVLFILVRIHNLLKFIAYKKMTQEEKEKIKLEKENKPE